MIRSSSLLLLACLVPGFTPLRLALTNRITRFAIALAHSALERKESRGSHQREDHEARDDEKYLKHSLAYYQGDDAPKIEYKDVVITRWPPAERRYDGKS